MEARILTTTKLDKGQKWNYHMNRIHIYTECSYRQMVRYFDECFNEELSKGEQTLVELTAEELNFDKFQEASGIFKQQSFW